MDSGTSVAPRACRLDKRGASRRRVYAFGDEASCERRRENPLLTFRKRTHDRQSNPYSYEGSFLPMRHGLGLHLCSLLTYRSSSARRIPVARSRNRIEHGLGVLDLACQHPNAVERVGVRDHTVARDKAIARLVANDPAVARRKANGSSGVCAECTATKHWSAKRAARPICDSRPSESRRYSSSTTSRAAPAASGLQRILANI